MPVDSSRSGTRNSGTSASEMTGNWVIVLGHRDVVVAVVVGVSRCRSGSIARLQDRRIVGRVGVRGGGDTVEVDSARTGARNSGNSISEVEGNWIINLGHDDHVFVAVGGT